MHPGTTTAALQLFIILLLLHEGPIQSAIRLLKVSLTFAGSEKKKKKKKQNSPCGGTHSSPPPPVSSPPSSSLLPSSIHQAAASPFLSHALPNPQSDLARDHRAPRELQPPRSCSSLPPCLSSGPGSLPPAAPQPSASAFKGESERGMPWL